MLCSVRLPAWDALSARKKTLLAEPTASWDASNERSPSWPLTAISTDTLTHLSCRKTRFKDDDEGADLRLEIRGHGGQRGSAQGLHRRGVGRGVQLSEEGRLCNGGGDDFVGLDRDV